MDHPSGRNFTERNLGLLKKGGFLAMVHPPGWRGFGSVNSGCMKRIRKATRRLDILWIRMTAKEDCGEAFPGITQSFDSYVIRNTRTKGFLTKLRGTDGSKWKADLKGAKWIPNWHDPLIDRMTGGDGPRVELLVAPDRRDIGDEPTEAAPHPCVFTVSKDRALAGKDGGKPRIKYSPESAFAGIPKVIFTDWNEAGIPIADRKGKHALSYKSPGIADKRKRIRKIARAMDSPAFRRAMDSVRLSGNAWNMNVIRLFKKDFWKEVDA